jgi:hypothetical protein
MFLGSRLKKPKAICLGLTPIFEQIITFLRCDWIPDR